MAEVTAAVVKKLRDQTGAGMMDCKRVLQDAEGDLKRAVELLRERGLAKASKREGRTTSEGTIGLALDGRAGGLVEIGCETDFVARTEDFQALARALAASVARDASLHSPEALLAAPLDGETVSERVNAAIAKLGENVVVKRVARLSVDGPGQVGGYQHAGGKLAVLVSLATPASGPEIDGLARDLSMHVAAADPSPLAVDASGVSAELIESERSIYLRQAEQEGKPEKVRGRIVEGKVRKFLSEVCLLQQPFVKDPDRTVGAVIEQVAKSVGQEISVLGFERFKLGESSEP